MGIVYHGSKVGNLTKLIPSVSMHGKLYVYATEYKQIALAYLGKFDGLTISQMIEEAVKSYEISNNINIARRYLSFYPHLTEKIEARFFELYRLSLTKV